jgi:cyclophilin family peptidyl-prolyl cis-trans isomerase
LTALLGLAKRPLFLALSLSVSKTALAQQPVSTADSALVRAILLAEDRRDASASALAEGARHPNPRISVLARRALGRIRDPKFAARDSLPPLPAPPKYDDPAWRLRLRAVNGRRTDCAAMQAALADSAWPVRFLAADRVAPECGADSALVRTLAGWVSSAPANARRVRGGVSWQAAGHGITALARLAPARARVALPAVAASPVPWLRAYAARAAGTLKDTTTLRRLARDPNDNVKEAAIDALATTAGHAADDDYVAALSATGYQAVRAGARTLKGSPRGRSLLVPLLTAEQRIAKDSSETSRDARIAIIERLGELLAAEGGVNMSPLAGRFDCVAMRAMDSVMTRLGATGGPTRCTPLAITLPPDAAALALGRDVRLRVTMADSSGGGSFIVKLRGDIAPIMAGRVLALARAGYYNGLTWHRVEHDFVVQGGGKANEYVGHPRFMRDELGTVPHMRGTVGMSTRGHDTGDAQWFFNLRDNLRLNGDYTVFAEVTDGIDVVDGVLEGDVIARIEVLPPR